MDASRRVTFLSLDIGDAKVLMYVIKIDDAVCNLIANEEVVPSSRGPNFCFRKEIDVEILFSGLKDF